MLLRFFLSLSSLTLRMKGCEQKQKPFVLDSALICFRMPILLSTPYCAHDLTSWHNAFLSNCFCTQWCHPHTWPVLKLSLFFPYLHCLYFVLTYSDWFHNSEDQHTKVANMKSLKMSAMLYPYIKHIHDVFITYVCMYIYIYSIHELWMCVYIKQTWNLLK